MMRTTVIIYQHNYPVVSSQPFCINTPPLFLSINLSSVRVKFQFPQLHSVFPFLRFPKFEFIKESTKFALSLESDSIERLYNSDHLSCLASTI